MKGIVFSLHSNSPLDVAVKGGMIADLMNIAGFMLPGKDFQLNGGPKTRYILYYCFS
jgi:hypothetical protein